MMAGESKDGNAAETRNSLTRNAYASLRRLILDNEMKPGRRMFEQEVADFLNMSRTPVREALIRLAEEGLVDVRPRRGMTVLPISAEDMRDIYDVVTSLEATATELAIARGVNSAEIDLLNDAVDAMEAALKVGDRTAWAKADEDFHRNLVHLSRNKRLISIVAGLWDQTHRARLATLSARPLPVASASDHRDLVNAIRRGEAERAKALHAAHRNKVRDMLVRLLAEAGPEQT